MFSRFEWMMAMRYLRAPREEGFISVIAWFSLVATVLGVFVLIAVMAVMNGYRQEILASILGVNGHLSVYASPQGGTNYEATAEVIADVPGVVSVKPMVEGQVMLTARGASRGGVVRGFDTEDLGAKGMIADTIKSGSLDDLTAENGVLIGTRLAEAMGLTVGDEITLISPKGNVTAFGTVPRVRPYRIAALFESGMYQYDLSFVFMALPAAQAYFKVPDAVTTFEVLVDDPDDAPALAQDIREAIGGGVRVLDWKGANNTLVNALKVERNVMAFILSAIILVAALSIVASLIMLVKDKGRDIAILRTMGATRAMVMRVFFIAGASIGVLGTLIGFVLGALFVRYIESIRQFLQWLIGVELFSPEIYFLSEMPAVANPMEIAVVVVAALVLTFLATLYPSWRAGRVDPAEALRYE